MAPLALAVAVLLAGSGNALAAPGGKMPPEQQPSSSDGEIVLHGGERLAWDQPGPSAAVVSEFVYRLYVDDVPAPFTETRCAATASTTRFACSGLLPAMTAGRHLLELTATARGTESSRSGMTVFVGRETGSASIGGAVRGRSAASDVEPSTVGPSTVCLGPAGAECYDARVVSSELGRIASPVRAGGRQVFFIEDERAVRVQHGDRLLEAPALTRQNPADRFVSLAVAPDFERERLVYVALRTPSRGGADELSITRYRELHGTLGQGATIVTGLRIPADATAPITVDDRGLLYVALPEAPDGSARDAVFGASVLRFTSDGTVPAGNPIASSPILARGYARPAAIVWDAAGQRLWLSGADPAMPGAVGSLERADAAPAAWPTVFRAAVRGDGVGGSPRLAITASIGSPDAAALWLVAAPDVVRRASVVERAELALAAVDFAPLAGVTQVLSGTGDDLLVVTADAASPERSSRIWRLTRSAR